MRVKTGIVRHRKHQKILKLARGYWISRHKLYKKAHEAVLHAGAYAFHGRKRRKRDFRSLWITRINARLASMSDGESRRADQLTYSQFIKALKDNKIEIDRKILAELALTQPAAFQKVVDATLKSKKPSARLN